MEDFFQKLFDILGYSEDQRVAVKNTLKETVASNLLADIVENLTPEERKQLTDLSESSHQDEVAISEWFNHYLKNPRKEMLGVIKASGEKAYKEFLAVILSDLQEDQAMAVKELAKEYMK